MHTINLPFTTEFNIPALYAKGSVVSVIINGFSDYGIFNGYTWTSFWNVENLFEA